MGDEELVTAFRFIGIDGIAVKDADEAASVFKYITEGADETSGFDLPAPLHNTGSCQILILTEETADWLGDSMIKWQISGQYPLLVEIPGIAGKISGRKTLVEAIREAIGIRV